MVFNDAKNFRFFQRAILFCFLFNSANALIAQTATVETLSEAQAKSLKSFKRINDHPLFEMTLHGDYDADVPLTVSSEAENSNGTGHVQFLFPLALVAKRYTGGILIGSTIQQ